VDVHVPHAPGYRDFTLAFSDNDPEIGQSHMPYPTVVKNPALVNYQSAPRPTDTGTAFSSQGSGDPPTPLLRAYAGDAVQVHALVAPGSEQMHVFNLGGFSWNLDPRLTNDSAVQSRGIGAWETVDAAIIGGAGGPAHATGDFFYGDLRRPFTQAGMWGLLRVLPPGGSVGRRAYNSGAGHLHVHCPAGGHGNSARHDPDRDARPRCAATALRAQDGAPGPPPGAAQRDRARPARDHPARRSGHSTGAHTTWRRRPHHAAAHAAGHAVHRSGAPACLWERNRGALPTGDARARQSARPGDAVCPAQL
jgi:hypothetical protein